jgi:ADP-heptose:LPS heptosyltransferase
MLPRGSRIPAVRKIVVLRCTALGDLIFALPTLAALRAAYPSAEIVLLALGRPLPRRASDRRRSRDPVPPSTRVHGPFDASADEDPLVLAAFFRAMRQEQFDLALQFHGGGRYANPFLRQLGARVTAGLKTPDPVALDR